MGGIWGGARTFALSQADKLCKPPLPYSVFRLRTCIPRRLKCTRKIPRPFPTKTNGGEFWSDDLVNLTFSPGPRWMAIGDQVLAAENSTLETAVR